MCLCFSLLLFQRSLRLEEAIHVFAVGLPLGWRISTPSCSFFLFQGLIDLFFSGTEKWLRTSYFSPCPGFRKREPMRPHLWLPACVSFPTLMSQFHSSASSAPLLSIFSPLEQTHYLNSPGAVLVCVQVSQPMDQWGRCRCKWISSLTLALESTKSAWKVRFSSALGLPTFPSMEESKNFKLFGAYDELMVDNLISVSINCFIAWIITLYR